MSAKIFRLFLAVAFVLTILQATPAYASNPDSNEGTGLVLAGGINTVEQWHQASEGAYLNAMTDHPFDVVITTYTESVNVVELLVSAPQGITPEVTGGSLISSTFVYQADGNECDCWKIRVSPVAANGLSEVVTRGIPTKPLPGFHVDVYAKVDGDAEWRRWSADVSTGINLVGGVNTSEGWYGAEEGKTINVVSSGEFYDVVVTSYTGGFASTVEILMATSPSIIPEVTGGTLVSSIFVLEADGNLCDCWLVRATPTTTGLTEVVVRSIPVMPLPGDSVYIFGRIEGHTWHGWDAVVSTGKEPVFMVFMPIVIR